VAFLALVYGAYDFAFGNCGVRKRSCGMWLKPFQIRLDRFADGAVDFVNHHWWNIRVCPGRRRWAQDGSRRSSCRLAALCGETCASVASGEPFEHEVRFRRAADAEYRWFLSRVVPLRDSGGKIVKWYGISTDIEDRKRAENERERLHSSRRI